MEICKTRREQRRRWLILLLATAAICFYIAAYFQPIWGFYLFAPQYPQGLTLGIYMDHLVGDTTEIDILNHYIGMAKLDSAAAFERSIAGYGLAAIGGLTLLMAIFSGTPQARFFAIPAIIFPPVLVGIMYFWMYKFGHDLSASAPVRMDPFTPKLLGEGIIGNFRTYGMPGPGFYLILGSALCVVAAVLVVRSVHGLRSGIFPGQTINADG